MRQPGVHADQQRGVAQGLVAGCRLEHQVCGQVVDRVRGHPARTGEHQERPGPRPARQRVDDRVGDAGPLCSVSTTTNRPAAKTSVDHGTREGFSSDGARKAATTTSATAATTAAIHTVTPAVRAITEGHQDDRGRRRREPGRPLKDRDGRRGRTACRGTRRAAPRTGPRRRRVRPDQSAPANGIGPSSPIRSTASRFVRFDTGSSSEAVFASQTVVSANGIGGRSDAAGERR